MHRRRQEGNMLNGRQLRKQFQQFNAQYFGSRLPGYAIRVVPHITWLGEAGYCNRKRRLIRIRAGRSDEETIGILLHEMAHAVPVVSMECRGREK